MRPRTVRAATVQGRFGVYTVPTIAAVDARLRALLAMFPTATPVGRERIRADIDTLLDRRLDLMGETR